MVIKCTFILLVCLMAEIPAMAYIENDRIKFDKLKHDFERFSEDSGAKTCVFRFTNYGSTPVAVAHVQTTCGCAVARYENEPVRPGETGEISITYNPQGRPGRFSRNALVRFSGKEQLVKLTLCGEVIPGVPRKHKMYPCVIGDLQLKTEKIRFGSMRGTTQEQSVVVINSGNKPLRLLFHSSDPTISVYMQTQLLKPGEVGEIGIIRKADKDKMKTKCIGIKESNAVRVSGELTLELVHLDCE